MGPAIRPSLVVYYSSLIGFNCRWSLARTSQREWAPTQRISLSMQKSSLSLVENVWGRLRIYWTYPAAKCADVRASRSVGTVCATGCHLLAWHSLSVNVFKRKLKLHLLDQQWWTSPGPAVTFLWCWRHLQSLPRFTYLLTYLQKQIQWQSSLSAELFN